MGNALLSLLFVYFTTGAGPETPKDQPVIYEPAYDLGPALHGSPKPYCPQPGDIFLASDKAYWARVGHWLAGSSGVHHSGIFFLRSDGRLALLEAGPFNSSRVQTSNPFQQLRRHTKDDHRVWIRSRIEPLTLEQSAQLTKFAEQQDGKPFAFARMFAMVTPFRPRGPLRTYYYAKPKGSRSDYFCSELVMESCVAAGLQDPATTRPSATFPRDLFFSKALNPYLNEHLHLETDWHPPARWTESPDRATGAK